MAKKLFSVIMCLMLMTSVMSISASAKTEIYTMDGPDFVKVISLPEDDVHIPEKSNINRLIPRFSFSGAEAFRFYSQLDSLQKSAYDQIVAAQAGLYSGEASETSATVTVVLDVSYAQWDSFWTQDGIDNVIQGALSAVIEDCPEFFWVGGYGWGVSAQGTSTGYKATIPVSIPLDEDAYANYGVVRSYYEGLIEAVENFNAFGTTRYEKLKSIHDQICKSVSYDTDFNNPIAHQPTSVFFEPFEPVCEGYAEAFKLICDKYGIPCIGVIGDASGEAHKWNYVQMEDGKWYGMDLTWDDQGSVMYDFFLAGADTKNAFFGQGGFLDGHTPTGEEFSGARVVLNYPTLSSTSYSMLIPNIGATGIYDSVGNRMYINRYTVLADEFFATANYSQPSQISGQTVTVNGNTTGATVTATNGGAAKIYTVVRWGDVDANNTVNSTDYAKMRAVVEGSGTIAENTANYWAADFDCDGAVDAFDLYYMNMYQNGLIRN